MTRPVDLPRWIDIVVLPLVNLALALLVSAVVVALIGLDPVQVITQLVKGAFGSRAGISYTLYYATTFVFTGLAVAVAFHGGLFNIGGEGQAMIGGLGCALAALGLGAYLPAWVMLPLMVVMTMWLPRQACSAAGTKAHKAPVAIAATTISGSISQAGK